MRVFFIYLTTLAFFSFLLLILRESGYKSTYGLKLQALYPIFETGLISYFFYRILKTKNMGLVLLLGNIFLLFFFIPPLFQKLDKLPFLPLALEEIFFMLVILFVLYEKIKFFSEQPIYNVANFWISLGFLINFSGTFFLFLFSISVPNKDLIFIKQYNTVVACFAVIKNILFCIAIYTNNINAKRQKSERKDVVYTFDQDDLPKILTTSSK